MQNMFIGLPQADLPGESLMGVVNDYGVGAFGELPQVVIFVDNLLVLDCILVKHPTPRIDDKNSYQTIGGVQ